MPCDKPHEHCATGLAVGRVTCGPAKGRCGRHPVGKASCSQHCPPCSFWTASRPRPNQADHSSVRHCHLAALYGPMAAADWTGTRAAHLLLLLLFLLLPLDRFPTYRHPVLAQLREHVGMVLWSRSRFVALADGRLVNHSRGSGVGVNRIDLQRRTAMSARRTATRAPAWTPDASNEWAAARDITARPGWLHERGGRWKGAVECPVQRCGPVGYRRWDAQQCGVSIGVSDLGL